MMTELDAIGFRQSHALFTAQVTKMTKVMLNEVYRLQLAEQGIAVVYGGPMSKDELVNAVVYYRFPVAKLNESTHVLYHKPDEIWPACNWCHDRHGDQCECDIGRAAAADA